MGVLSGPERTHPHSSTPRAAPCSATGRPHSLSPGPSPDSSEGRSRVIEPTKPHPARRAPRPRRRRPEHESAGLRVFGGPLRVRDVPARCRSRRASSSGSGPAACAAATGTAGRATTRTSPCRTCPATSSPGRSRRSGAGVRGWRVGDRVTVPFVCACGRCAPCAAGDQQVCEHQTQPGFTHWGSFAEHVASRPPTSTSWRCRTSCPSPSRPAWAAASPPPSAPWSHQGRVRPGEWVAVHGCGGVGLSAVQIAVAAGARVVAVDVAPGALELARAARRGGGRRLPRTGRRRRWRTRCATPPAAGRTCPWTRSAAPAPASPRSLCLRAAAATSRSACCRRRGRAGRADGPGHRPRARDARQPRHGGARLPGDAGAVAAGLLRPDLLVTRELGLDEAGAAFAGLGSVPGIAVVTRF